MRSRTMGPASGGVRSPLPIAHAAPVGLLESDASGVAGAGKLVAAPANRMADRMADPESFREGERAIRDDGEAAGFRLDTTDRGRLVRAVARSWSRYSDAAHAEPIEIIRQQAAVDAAPAARPAGAPAWTETVDA